MTARIDSSRAALDLLTDDFDFDLPPGLIAQHPREQRDASRLLVLDRASGAHHHSLVRDLGNWLSPGDLLVANNSRVFPARLRGRRIPSGGAAELLLLRPEEGGWRALARPAKRLSIGSRLTFAPHDASQRAADAVVSRVLGGGEVLVRFDDDADKRLELYGEVPLPPYIETRLEDSERYQTVFARAVGSAAAPTAGLHFTPDLIAKLRYQGLGWAEVTLHIGLDTFRPVSEERVADHPIHSEWCHVPADTARAIAKCRSRGGRVVAVGTTVARTLETLGETWNETDPAGCSGFTQTFILPGHRWRLVDALLTNFHLPRSTLIMLVSALAGREHILAAYAEAIRAGYRFYSFGDAMLIN